MSLLQLWGCPLYLPRKWNVRFRSTKAARRVFPQLLSFFPGCHWTSLPSPAHQHPGSMAQGRVPHPGQPPAGGVPPLQILWASGHEGAPGIGFSLGALPWSAPLFSFFQDPPVFWKTHTKLSCRCAWFGGMGSALAYLCWEDGGRVGQCIRAFGFGRGPTITTASFGRGRACNVARLACFNHCLSMQGVPQAALTAVQ